MCNDLTISDEALYRRLLAGDVAALEALVPRYHGPLLGFLYRQIGDRHLAEDLVQETFTRLVTYRGAPPERFKPWAYTIARNLARDHARSAYVRREQAGTTLERGEDGLNGVVDLAPGAEDLLLREDDRQAVAAALARLSPEQREVLILRFYHDLKLEEIAEVTGVALGTVKSRLHHGLKRMKTWLAPEPAEDQEGGMAYGAAAPALPGRRAHA